jgi:hypothetical protein
MTLTLLSRLIATVIIYLALALSYLGIGWAGSRLFKISIFSKHKFFALAWAGWAFALLLLQALNLFFPINAYSSIPLLLFGLISAVNFFITEFRSGTKLALPGIYLILLVIAALWIADLSMFAPNNYDSGLYHFISIHWLNESPIVLGLGNLYGRLAFNQSFFSYVAYLNLYPLFNHGYNLANSFLLLLLLSEYLLLLTNYIARKERRLNLLIADMAAIAFIPVLIYLALNSNLPSPTPDTASSVLEILIFIQFIRVILERPSTSGNTLRIVFILILSATAITIKLSNLFFVLSVCAFTLLNQLKGWYISTREKIVTILKWMALPALIIFVWCLRGILLSGCPVYPSTFGCIKTPWAMPLEDVRSEAAWIYSWSRTPIAPPGKVLGTWDWLQPWFFREVWTSPVTILYPVLIFIVIAIAGILILLLKSSTRKIKVEYFYILLPVLIGLICWFISAPNIRFASSLFWILPVAAMATFIKIMEPVAKVHNRIFIALILILSANIIFSFAQNPDILTRLNTKGYIPIPKNNIAQITTLSGLNVYYPSTGDQCWDSKLPCTPHFNPNLSFIARKIFPEFVVINSTK